MGTMYKMDESGDSRVVWDEEDEVSVRAAETAYNHIIKEGYAAFSVHPNGEKKEQIFSFKPDLEEILFVPQMRGG